MTENHENIALKLKQDTRELHDEVEKELNSQAILSEDYSRQEYAALLQQLYPAHLSLEPQILNFDSIARHSELEPDRRLNKAKLLRHDLEKLTLVPQEQKLSVKLENKSQAWGALYVLEGSSLGGAIILKQLKKLNWEEEPFTYYGYYGNSTGPMWKKFRDILQQVYQQESLDDAQLTEGARKAYYAFMGKELSA